MIAHNDRHVFSHTALAAHALILLSACGARTALLEPVDASRSDAFVVRDAPTEAAPPADAACSTGFVRCDGVCTNTASDSTNCGACGRRCGAGEGCVAARCEMETSFRLEQLGTMCVLSDNHEAVAGDDRGGLVVGGGAFYYSGDNFTITGDAESLRRGMGGVGVHDGLVADLRGDRAYVFTDEAGREPRTNPGPQTITQLRELDLTGSLTGGAVRLSIPIVLMPAFAGVYSGYGRVIVYAGHEEATGTEGRGEWYDIALPRGRVVPLGVHPSPPGAARCETWAHWGIAEFFDGQYHVTYARSTFGSRGVFRYTVLSGAVTPLLPVGQFGDVCMLAFSTRLSRWYFHFELAPDFEADPSRSGEYLAACPARFVTR